MPPVWRGLLPRPGPRFGWKTESAGAVLFLAGLGALLGVAAAIAYLTRSLDDAAAAGMRLSDWRQSTFQVMDAVQDADAGQRGYLLTGEPAYLEQLQRAAKAVPGRVVEMKQLTPEDERQQGTLARVEAAIGGKLAEIRTTADLKAAGRTAEALAIADAPESRALMQAIRGSMRQLVDYQTSGLMDIRGVSSRNRQWLLVGTSLALALSVLLLGAAVIASLAQLRRARERETELVVSNEMLERLVRERTESLERATHDLQRESEQMQVLLNEINHRVGNSMQMVSSFLGLQADRTEHPEAKEALAAARARVQAMASAQRRLRLSGTSDVVQVDSLLENLVADIRSALARDSLIDISVAAEPVSAPSRTAVSIGVILHELVSNALKYAFPDNRAGSIRITLNGGKDNAPSRLTIEDDGVGIPTVRRRSGLGLDVVRALAMSLDAQVSTETVNASGPNPGARIILNFTGAGI